MYSQSYGSLEAIDDAATTGPMQSVRINVMANDTMPCIDNYTWRIVSTPDPFAQGVATQNGDYLVFQPALGCRNTTVDISYAMRCGKGSNEVTATVSITVTQYNAPINVLPADIKCWEEFTSTGFGVDEMFASNNATPKHSHQLLSYSLPIVGDLNGDLKPEILAIGIRSYDVRYSATARYITILDGQTGKTLVEFDTETEFVVSRDNPYNSPAESAYHSSPSYLAIADVDNDGKGEIIMAFPVVTDNSSSSPNKYSEQVVAFKVVTNSANTITGLQEYWTASIGYKAPLTGTNHLYYDVPTPYIADLNGDGIPEVIVYNKIYNAQTGRLLMAWDGPASASKGSSLASGSGLSKYEHADIFTDESVSDNVYNRAFVGCRPNTDVVSSSYRNSDTHISVFAVENMDGDDDLEVIAGNRIYKFQFNDLGKDENSSHENNTYTTIEGPRYVTLPTTGSNTVTYYLSDGFTRVADIDGDGHLDVVTISKLAVLGGFGGWGSRATGLITVWDPRYHSTIKAASAFYGGGASTAHIPTFGIPFIGDINGKIDGWDASQSKFTKKLPEIGLITSDLYINSSNSAPKRNGITFHPLSDENLRQGVVWDNNNTSASTRRFNRNNVSGRQGHIFAVTYCDSAGVVPPHRRLKLSWAMEHADRSANTGLTIFDFNNDGAKDLVYRDEATLRVISPKIKDYVEVGETETTTGTSVMFRTAVTALTGYEAQTIADVNMDASADIVVTQSNGEDFDNGHIRVYQYKSGTSKWAPAPPVWNQAYYNPRHIGEDLRVPSRPTPMLLTTYTDGDGAAIYPYNNAWEQLHYVLDSDPETPVVRLPDAALSNMAVDASSASTTKVTLTIRNLGLATIPANTPVTFYKGEKNLPFEIGDPNTTKIGKQTIGVDIYPNESVVRTFTLSSDCIDRLVWARIMDDDGAFLAPGFADCDTDNNAASGAYCLYMKYEITPAGDSEICANATITLTATRTSGTLPQASPTFQWFRNDKQIDGATGQDYSTAVPGEYTCYVTENICRQYTAAKSVKVRFMEAHDDHAVVIKGLPAYIRALANDTIPQGICTPAPDIETDPAHGTAFFDGELICYTSANNYTGTDVIEYSLMDGVTATVHLTVIEAPGDISVAECAAYPPTAPWTIRELPVNLRDTIDNFGPLTAGDIDGDDSVEILAYKPSTVADERSGMKMFSYRNGHMELKRSFDFRKKDGSAFESSALGAPAIARYNGKGYIVVLNRKDRRLYAFSEAGVCEWESADEAADSQQDAAMIGITDFNADGIPEVYAGNRIFSLSTGALLCKGDDADNKGSYSSIAADMDGDGLPELCAGTQIYKVAINAGAMSVFIELDAAQLPADAAKDGATQVADIDSDSQLEVVVVSHKSAASAVTLYVWKPLPNDRSYLVGSYAVAGGNSYGVPAIGNIDADPYPEIIFTAGLTSQEIRALDYLPAAARGSQIGQKWTMGDAGAAPISPGISLFDFDQDTIVEIVYRDEEKLRIIDGRTPSPAALGTVVGVTSGTRREMPVIADVDGDGRAEIIVSGGRAGVAGADAEKTNGYLRVFKSAADAPWAPARKVWNQYAYHAVNIRNDLTVPSRAMNPATLFRGDGCTYSGDGARPYNAFMQQQTAIDSCGLPVWLAPIGEFVAAKSAFRYFAEQDSMAVDLVVTNNGDAGFQSPLYITAYKNTGYPGNEIVTDSILSLVNVGDTVAFTLSIPHFSSHMPMDAIEIRLNDRGSALLVQAECTSRQQGAGSLQSNVLMANNDAVSLFANTTVVVDLLANDSIPAACASPSITIVTQPKHGTLSQGVYTPNSDYLGADTIIYRLACDRATSTAMVKILVASVPDNMGDGDCSDPAPGIIGGIEKKAESDSAVYWLATPFVGDLDNDGLPEVVVPDTMYRVTGYTSRMLIFNDTLKLKAKITLPSPTILAYSTMAFLIADVDSDDYGEIVFCTTDRKVHCYGYDTATKDWTERWVSGEYTGVNLADTCPSLIIADIDNDGKTEILAGDMLLAGEDGARLLTLPAGGRGYAAGSPAAYPSYMPVFADVDNDGMLEIVAGNTVYKATIKSDRSGGVAWVLATAPASLPDGFTSVADVDSDGDPDVIVTGDAATADQALMYVWDGETPVQIGQTVTVTSKDKHISRPSAGDIDGNDSVDIVFSYTNTLEAYRYDAGSRTFVRILQKSVDEDSGATAVSLFDFDMDGKAELVHRDKNKLRIIDENGNDLVTPIDCYSSTHTEYPVIVDLDRDGHADILVSGKTTGTTPLATGNKIIRYGSTSTGNWAPARPVWNQHACHPLHINDDLSVPAFPLNPAVAVFAGADGVPGSDDDVRPYNNFLQQQMPADFSGMPYRPLPDVTPVASRSNVEMSSPLNGRVTVAIYNRGSGVMKAPFDVELYKESVSAPNLLKTESAAAPICPGDTAYIAVDFNITSPADKFVVRLNSSVAECETGNNEAELLQYGNIMKKNASINGAPGNGIFGNPVTIYYSETIHYEITARNVGAAKAVVAIRDTLPAYLNYVDGSGSPAPSVSTTTGTPARWILAWTGETESQQNMVVSYYAQPDAGVCVSQPMFANRAWVTLSAMTPPLTVATGSTYHQGGGASVVTFSAGHGGTVYNARPQMVDYKTPAAAGVLAVPDEGYAFAGWRHDDYYSLRGERVNAKSSILHYDTLVIFGNVALRADFELIRYPVHYYLNGGENAGANPSEYTCASAVKLEAPRKAGDEFVGWTGSNGIVPQATVIIPEGSTGEREFYANYLRSGREDVSPQPKADMVWAVDGELHIRTSKAGSVARIYTPDGILEGVHALPLPGLTRIKLGRGVHIVILNSGPAQKVMIE